jgi:hypothetical protein
MFGLFKKKVPPDLRALIQRNAREAHSHIVGQISGTEYCVSRGRINLTDSAEHDAVKQGLIKRWKRVSHNRERWPQQIQDFLREAETPAATKYEVAAMLLITGVLMTDALCKVALEYPDDKEITDGLFQLVTKNMAGFDLVIEGPAPKPFGEPTASTELMSELEFANALIQKKAALC